MLRNGITTVGKTFRVICTVTNERFVGWYDLTDQRITAFPNADELPEDKYYVEVRGNTYTLVIQTVVVADGGNYTCRGDKTAKVFTLYVECRYLGVRLKLAGGGEGGGWKDFGR